MLPISLTKLIKKKKSRDKFNQGERPVYWKLLNTDERNWRHKQMERYSMSMDSNN